jgi:hypothetical protein
MPSFDFNEFEFSAIRAIFSFEELNLTAENFGFLDHYPL